MSPASWASVTVEVPLKLVSMANARMHWATKARTWRTQRIAVGTMIRGSADARAWHWLRRKVMAHSPTGTIRQRCTLTRVGAKQLDSDNLQSAFKAVRDEVAEWVCCDDGSDEWEWVYKQERGLYCVRIQLEVLP